MNWPICFGAPIAAAPHRGPGMWLRRLQHMPTNTVCVKVDAAQLLQDLRAAREKLDSADGELVLDFSTVRRIDAAALATMGELAGAAEGKSVKITLCGLSVEVYKAFKLGKLAGRFS